jgi:hypothetical protein
LSLGGIVSSGLEISEPLSNWELAQEATERKRLREMDDAFCAALAAAIKRGKEKESQKMVHGIVRVSLPDFANRPVALVESRINF